MTIELQDGAETRTRFEFTDVVALHPLLASLPLTKRFVESAAASAIDSSRFRLKHAYEYVDSGGANVCFVNARHEVASSGWGSVGYLLKVNYETGEVLKVFHDDIVEGPIFSGAADPRYFRRGEEIGVIFNAPCKDGNRRIFIYFEHLNHCVKLSVPDLPLRRIEKNWTAMTVGDVIYIVYSFNPTIVLRLDDEMTGICSLASDHAAFVNPVDPLYPYGGSSLKLWSWPNYVGLVHSRHPYRPAFVLFNAAEMCVAALGTPFAIPEPQEAVKWRGRDVQYPYHLDFDETRCEAWIECQDRCPTKVEFSYTRFREIVSSLIALS
jgi:hypothetical protein